MRPALLALALIAPLLLTGCAILVDENGDYFEIGHASFEQFEADIDACTQKARDAVSYDLHTFGGTTYDRHRAYNAVFEPCMTARGYKPRAYVENLLP